MLQMCDGHGVPFDRTLGEFLVKLLPAQSFEARDFLLALFVY